MRLTLEDLLNGDGSRCWLLAEIVAQRPRVDLQSSGVEAACGFLFLGHSGVQLPPLCSGLVLRAFFDAEQSHELSGSPLGLDAQAYARLKELCLLGLGRPGPHLRAGGPDGAGLGQRRPGPPAAFRRRPSRGHFPARPPTPGRVAIPDRSPHRAVRWPCAPSAAGEPRRRIDERGLDLTFQLTPWPVLLRTQPSALPRPPLPLAVERQACLLGWLDRADREGIALPPQLALWQRLVSHPLRRDGAAGSPGPAPGP